MALRVGSLSGQAPPPPTGTAARPCGPSGALHAGGARLPETVIAFARLYPCGFETVIAFAGEKRAFLVQFVGAEVMAVSAVPCWGCAEVMPVSVVPFWGCAEVMAVSAVPCWGRAVVLLVSTSPCFCVLCAKFVALHGLMWVRARKSSPFKPKTGEKCSFQACWANYFAEEPLEGLCWASFFAPIGPEPRSCRRRGARGWLRWGFCTTRSWLAACRRRVVVLMTPFPPFGGGEVAA